MMENTVITTEGGKNYHRPDCNLGFKSAREKSVNRGGKKNPILTMTESEAIRLGRKACGHCGGR